MNNECRKTYCLQYIKRSCTVQYSSIRRFMMIGQILNILNHNLDQPSENAVFWKHHVIYAGGARDSIPSVSLGRREG